MGQLRGAVMESALRIAVNTAGVKITMDNQEKSYSMSSQAEIYLSTP
jgi:hypothetical protein